MARKSQVSAPSKKQTELLKKQQDAELLKKQQEAEEEADSDFELEEDKDDGVFAADSDEENEEFSDAQSESSEDSDAEEADDEEADDEEEVDVPTKDGKASKPRRAFVDPLEIKELILLGTKGAITKAGKMLDSLSRQLEKIQNKMAKKKASGPRKLSAYNVFTKKHMVDVQEIESKLRMKELGQRWKKLSEKEKAKYKKMAEEANAALQTEA